MIALKDPRAIADTGTGSILAMTDLPATPEEVFYALTDGAAIAEWWGSDDTYHMRDWDADLCVNGKYTVKVHAASGQVFPASGYFLAIKWPSMISHTRKYDWDHPTLGQRETRITYMIVPIESATRQAFGKQPDSASSTSPSSSSAQSDPTAEPSLLTRLTIRHEGFSGLDAAAYEHADGWERVLGWLKEHIESIHQSIRP